MLNGKISRMPVSAVVQMLAGMNANNIEKVELITTPPANFHAEGNAGYINIVMKENTQYGTNGSYSVSAGYGNGLEFSTGINFHYHNQKINIYGDHSFSRRAVNQEMNFYRKINQLGRSLETTLRKEAYVFSFETDPASQKAVVYNRGQTLIYNCMVKVTVYAFGNLASFNVTRLETYIKHKNKCLMVTGSGTEYNLNWSPTLLPNKRLSISTTDYAF